MTNYKRGDIVLVSFVFSDESGVKQRPAVVISTDEYHRQRQEVIIQAVTSRTDRILIGDYLIRDWKEARLISPSVATGIIRTVKRDIIIRKLGTLSNYDLNEIEQQLVVIVGLKRGVGK